MNNDHIFSYLDYYVDLPHPPHYAVMLTGPWGIGKSFNIKRYVRGLENRGKKIAYVSLYGVKSVDDIAVSVLTALTIGADNKLAKFGNHIGRLLWTRMPNGSGNVAMDVLADFDLLVLDDLERAILSPHEVLGFVNSLIEHEDRRVVLVANEVELDDQETYRRVREKVIGITFELSEEAEAALIGFMAALEDSETRLFLESATSDILEIFDQSQTKNLRLLDQSLRAWERVFRVIDPELKKKRSGMVAAFKLFLALSLEVRAGRIGPHDLNGRVDKIVTGTMRQNNGASDGTPLSHAQGRYGRLYLHDSVLSDAVLTAVLCEGRIDAASINSSLAVHELFVVPDEEPNWRKVWHGFLREADEFGQAFEALEREFLERKFEEAGEVLHVLGLRLWVAEIGELQKSEADLIAEGKAYIDDLRRHNRLRRHRPDNFCDASHGLGFHHGHTAAFRELRDYFVQQAEVAYQDGWPELAKSLLDDMERDAEAFYRRVCWSGRDIKPDCAEDPVLCKVAAKEFVNRLIECSPTAQRTILEALKCRYQHGGITRALAAEGEWLIGVHQEIESKLLTLPRIRQYSLQNDTKRLLGNALREAQDVAHAVQQTPDRVRND